MKVRRIVAALHLHRRPGNGLEAIAELASRMEADLLGLFIEDVELLRLAALPFACEIGAASARQRGMDLAEMERSMRARAQDLQAALGAALGARNVPWSFRVARGAIAGELLAAGTEQAGPTLLLPPGSNLADEPLVVFLDELTEPRLRELLDARRPVLILPRGQECA